MKQDVPPLITPEAVTLFARIDGLYDRYVACAMGGPCYARRGTGIAAECRMYLDGGVELNRLLGLGPEDICPTDAEAEAPDDPDQLERWRKAYDLRGKLLDAVAKSTRRRATSRRSRRSTRPPVSGACGTASVPAASSYRSNYPSTTPSNYCSRPGCSIDEPTSTPARTSLRPSSASCCWRVTRDARNLAFRGSIPANTISPEEPFVSTVPARIASYSTSVEITTKAAECIRAVRVLAIAGLRADAQRLAERFVCSQAFQQIITKAAVPAATTLDSTWAGPLVSLQLTAPEAFVASLRDFGAFDRMLDDMIRLPVNSRIAAVSSGASGVSPNEGDAKAISRLTVGNADLTPLKSLAILSS